MWCDNAKEAIRGIVNREWPDETFVIVDWKPARIFDIGPRDFLLFAKKDLEEDTDRGKINGLGNAKRAINCRVDEIIKTLNLEELATARNWGLPYKLEVLNSFPIVAPKVLTEWVNKKRNLLEHEYERPRDIKHIIDVAELFIEATNRYVNRGLMNKIVIAEKGEVADESDQEPPPRYPTLLRYQLEIKFNKHAKKIDLLFQLAAIPRGKDPISDKKRKLRVDIVDEDRYSTSLNDMDQVDLKEIMRFVWDSEFKTS